MVRFVSRRCENSVCFKSRLKKQFLLFYSKQSMEDESFINASIVSYRPPDGAVSMGMYLGEDRWSTAIIYSLICWLPILLLDSMTSVKNICTWIIYCILLFYIHYVIVTQYIIFKYCSKCILNHSGLLIWRLLPVARLELEFPPH